MDRWLIHASCFFTLKVKLEHGSINASHNVVVMLISSDWDPFVNLHCPLTLWHWVYPPLHFAHLGWTKTLCELVFYPKQLRTRRCWVLPSSPLISHRLQGGPFRKGLSNAWGFPTKKGEFSPQIIHFNRGFHEINHQLWGFPPYFWKHPHWKLQCLPIFLVNYEVVLDSSRSSVPFCLAILGSPTGNNNNNNSNSSSSSSNNNNNNSSSNSNSSNSNNSAGLAFWDSFDPILI